jgi:SAM-dependent methyltransferase
VTSEAASAYGDAHAKVYDRIYGARFSPESAVAALANAAGPGGRLLELGVGTGRLALPLARRGIRVEAIEASAAMIEQVRSQAGSELIDIFKTDMTEFSLPHTDFDVAVCAVSTLFMLEGPTAQASCIASAAHHLRLGGLLFIEAFRLDPDRFDKDGRRVERRLDPRGVHVVRSRHDAVRHCLHITHEFSDESGHTTYSVSLHYTSNEEMDEMARSAGLRLRQRWHDWNGKPLSSTSPDPISVYEKVPRPRF